jgi:hypothetical protein
MTLTGLATSLAVNALVTGLIVFKILEVFLEFKPTSVERTLGSAEGSKLGHIIFIIIESGMALFAIQLVRVVFTTLVAAKTVSTAWIGMDFVIGIHEMLNVIIISTSFASLMTFTLLGHRANNNSSADPNEVVLR